MYNGNIAETLWRTSSDNIARMYSYTYDSTNRLLDAWYRIPGSGVTDSYNEHLSYDANGNILSLKRLGEVEDASSTMVIDDLVYEYDDGNKLINVTDDEYYPAGFNDGNNPNDSGQDDFEYDAYGNLTVDRNKRIRGITYNHLNLPKSIFFEEGQIHYLYNANGVKVKKTVESDEVTNTHYLDGFQYTDDHLVFFPHAEGYVNVLEGVEFNYVYTYKDHLGNIRLRYALNPDTANLTILEEDHYYPFGLKHKGYNSGHEMFQWDETRVVLTPVTPFDEDKFKYKHQGQERQDEFGLNWDSFKWRNYDYALGRFMSIDPLAEKYAYNSPYAFQENKIGLGRELEGLEMVSERNKDGKSVTITYTVKPVNNTGYANAPGTMLSNKDFNTLIQTRADQTEATMSGQTTSGENVTVNVEFDDNATIIWEYNTMIDTEGTATEQDRAFKEMSPGKTTEIGNTQNNKTQVNVLAHFTSSDAILDITQSGIIEATKTGTHEDAHVGGGRHNNIPGNVMQYPNPGTHMTPEQRDELVKRVEEQQ